MLAFFFAGYLMLGVSTKTKTPSAILGGTTTDGIYRYTITIPQGAAQGTWSATSFLLVDQVGNMRSLSTQQMTNAGFTISFVNG
jgi:hypothetical protein